MIHVQVPRNVHQSVDVPESVASRSCKGSLTFRSLSTKVLTNAEWEHLEGAEPELVKRLRVVGRTRDDEPEKKESEVKKEAAEREAALEKQAAMPSERFKDMAKAEKKEPVIELPKPSASASTASKKKGDKSGS